MYNDHKQIAANLRALADRYDVNSVGTLNFNTLGDVFGNEFWNLILYHNYDAIDKTVEAFKKAMAKERDL